jgi:hypothetical protein
MWILTPSITSAFAAATGASTSASNEQLAAAFARSLLSRSKPSPQRTWLQRLKRDSWTTHLSGAISSDSLGESFTDWWISSLAATRASHSAQPASASEPKTHDTSGLTYQPELLSSDQVSVSLKTSRDISALGYPTCCKTWSDWVTERRGAWRQRVNAARLTRGKGSSSWPSVTTRDHHSQGSGNNQKSPSLATTLEKNWPTIRASEYKDVGPVGSKSHQHMLGKHYLCAVVTQEAAKENWLTPQSGDVTGSTQDAVVMWANGQRPKTCDQRLRTQVAAEQLKHGQAAPANWPTPIQGDSHLASTPEAAARRLAEGKSTLSRLVESGQAAPASSNTLGSRQELWPTASVPNGGQTTSGRADKDTKKQVRLEHAVKQWGTPAANDANKTPHCEVNSNQAGLAKSVGLELQRQWATPRTPTGGPESAQRKQELGRTTSGGGDLASQASGKLSSQWVCTLMGLPMGWVSPSCPASVIKNWPRFVTGWLQATTAPTSCDSSGTALCQPSQSERSDFFLAS